MAITAFPNGASSFGIPLIGSGAIPATTGTYYFVDSVTGANTNDGLSPATPFATLVYALTQTVASKGDVVILMPTHAETIATAGGVTMSKIGVSVIGLGQGAFRPTFSFSAVGSTWAISAASCTVSNIRVTSTVDEMVKMFHITAASVTIDRVDHFETASCQTIQFILTTAAADYLTVRNCYHYQVTAAAATQVWIQLVGIDGGIIENNTFRLTLRDHAGSIVINGSTACIGTVVRNNTIVQLGGTNQLSGILFVDSSTGVFAHDNRVAVGASAITTVVDVGNAGYAAENYGLNTADASGALIPAVDS
jgi:hypothetical protein